MIKKNNNLKKILIREIKTHKIWNLLYNYMSIVINRVKIQNQVVEKKVLSKLWKEKDNKLIKMYLKIEMKIKI